MASTFPADSRPSDETSASSQEAPQSLAARSSDRSRQSNNQAFRDFIGSGWGPCLEGLSSHSEAAPWAAARREALGRLFPGGCLVLPAGTLKMRDNDCDYRFRPHNAFAHLAGTGTDFEPGAVLILDPLTKPSQDADSPDGSDDTDDVAPTHEAAPYFRPRASRSSRESYGDPCYGKLWVGVRPSLEEVEASTGMCCAHIDSLPDALAKDAGLDAVQLRVVTEVDESVTALVTTTREKVGLQTGQDAAEVDAGLAEAVSELRLVKDPWEIDQLHATVAVTRVGFDDLVRSIPRARDHWRSERVLEGAFRTKVREEGNDLGYDTIVVAGNRANTLHWINNDGVVEPDQLALVDAGVEVDSLYTANVTRTIPVDDRFTEVRRRVYQAVLDAADATFARAGTPGYRFKDVHTAAMEVIAAHLEEWGMLSEGVSAADSLAPEDQYHRRWMVHSTSHHLGLDIHGCAQARRGVYMEAEFKPDMCFIIEPGLYFREGDLLVPTEMRDTDVRIEDDVVVREDGSVECLTQDVPRTVEEVEAWVSGFIAD